MDISDPSSLIFFKIDLSKFFGREFLLEMISFSISILQFFSLVFSYLTYPPSPSWRWLLWLLWLVVVQILRKIWRNVRKAADAGKCKRIHTSLCIDIWYVSHQPLSYVAIEVSDYQVWKKSLQHHYKYQNPSAEVLVRGSERSTGPGECGGLSFRGLLGVLRGLLGVLLALLGVLLGEATK